MQFFKVCEGLTFESIVSEAFDADEMKEKWNNQTIEFKCIGKSYTCNVYLRTPLKDLFSEPVIKSISQTLNNNEVWEYLYEENKDWFEKEINNDPYYKGKKIESGKDLKTSIEKISAIGQYKNIVYVAGEYWVDDEHGFSISFPNGKFTKSGKEKTELKGHSSYL